MATSTSPFRGLSHGDEDIAAPKAFPMRAVSRCARSTGAHTKTRRASVRVGRIRGEEAYWAAESVAPSGARFDLVMEPTADAVGYRLSVLRTCRGSQGRTRSHGEGDEDIAAPFLFSKGDSVGMPPQPWKPRSRRGQRDGNGYVWRAAVDDEQRRRQAAMGSGPARDPEVLEWSGRHSGKGRSCQGMNLERKGDSCWPP